MNKPTLLSEREMAMLRMGKQFAILILEASIMFMFLSEKMLRLALW
mgnify:CR=1 FL=1